MSEKPMFEAVPTGIRTLVVEDGGAKVTARVLTRTQLTKVATAAEIAAPDRLTMSHAEKLREFMWTVRAACVGWEGLLDDAGKAVPFALVRHAVLGEVAPEAVYDALPAALAERIFYFAQGLRLAGAHEKNSGTPPAPS